MGAVVLNESGETIFTLSEYIEKADPHQARCRSLLAVLDRLKDMEPGDLSVCSDNDTFIGELKGIYSTKDPLIKRIRNIIRETWKNLKVEFRQMEMNELSSARNLAGKGLAKYNQRTLFTSSPYFTGPFVKIFGVDRNSSNFNVQHSAGGILYRRDGDHYKICIISKRNSNVWTLPKGRADGDETPEETAIREVGEETGHRGIIESKIDQINYYFYLQDQKTLFHKFVIFYLMRLEKENAVPKDNEADEVRWLPPGEAYRKVTYTNEKKVVKKARKILEMM